MTAPAHDQQRDVDVAIIGAGTAGLSAYRAVKESGHSVVLIDHGPLGTMCARVGCMPSKAMLHAAMRWSTTDRLAGWDDGTAAAARDRLWRDVREMRDQLAGGTADSTREDVGADLVMGRARFAAADLLVVDDLHIRARGFIVATGSHPNLPEAFRQLGDLALTTDTLFELDTLPASVGVVGLGNVGVEIGLALARFGLSTAGFDEQHSVGGAKDPAIARRAVERLGRELPMTTGVEVRADVVDGRVRLRWREESERGGGTRDEQHATFDRVLVALGRSPNLADLDLAAAGIVWPDGQPAPIDPGTLRLGDSSIFVVGDAAPLHPLQHEAVDDGCIATRNVLALLSGSEPLRAARRTPLSIVFTDPDLAQVGIHHPELDDAATLVAEAGGDSNGRSKLLGEETNLVRLYVDRGSRRIVGASMCTTHGEHLAHLVAFAIGRELTVDELLAAPFYHPTIEELLQEALKQAICALDDDSRNPS